MYTEILKFIYRIAMNYCPQGPGTVKQKKRKDEKLFTN